MRKHAKGISKNTSTQTRRFHVICVVGIVIVFAIAATAISMQASKGESQNGEKSNPQAGSNSRGHALPLRAAQNSQTDGQLSTQAQIRPLTQEEAQRMAEGLKKLVNQSSEGLQQVQHADGSVSMDLQGRFQSVVLARKTEDGRIVQSCVDNPRSAAAFLGIDRELIDGIKTISPANTREGAQNQ
jgi:hypothetical protein